MRLISTIALFVFVSGCGGGGSNTSTGAGATAASATGENGQVMLSNQIVAVGDSIGVGTGASTNFPSIVEALTGIPVVNASVGGIDAEGGALRGADLLDRLRPRFIIALLGTNNATGAGGGVSGAVNALQFLADAANSVGATIVIGTLPPISRSANENAAASAISSGILGITGARIVRVDQAVLVSEVIDAGLHPNDSGQGKIGRLFASQIF